MLIKVTEWHINRGMPEHGDKCPIALAIRGKVRWKSVYVDPGVIEVGCSSGRPPKKVSKFIRRFDAGKKVRPFSFRLPKLKAYD